MKKYLFIMVITLSIAVSIGICLVQHGFYPAVLLCGLEVLTMTKPVSVHTAGCYSLHSS